MDILGSDWLNLAVRWTHVTVGIAWIGSSFLFNWMDSHLRPSETPRKGVAGELWMVHGGGFYQLEKYTVAPDRLPPTLHWFKWEAYTTWISGMCLLALVYFLGASTYLLKPDSVLSPEEGVAVALIALAVGWIVYDTLCRLLEGKSDLVLAALVTLWMLFAAWGFSQIFSGRAAFIMVGAMIGTIMAGNVFLVIIPNQKLSVASLLAGEEPDPAQGRRGKQRSLHNNYLTLPVLFTMVSNHYPIAFSGASNWLVLAGLAAVGVFVRHFFNLKNKDRLHLWMLPAAAAAMIALAFLGSSRAPAPPTTSPAGSAEAAPVVSFDRVVGIIDRRCVACHSANPTWEGIAMAPKGVKFDTAEEIRRHVRAIHTLSVATDAMPLGNVTGMTPEERAVLGAWIESGAEIE